MPELVFYRRGEELVRVTLGARTVVGRGPECDVTIPHPEVSRSHAAVERGAAGWRVVDLSGRGTVVGGGAVAEAPLADGTELGFGDYRAVFRTAAREPATGTVVDRERTERAGGGPELPEGALLRLGSRAIPLGDEVTIGTDPGCTVRLEDRFASGVHCRLVRRGARLTLHDLDSTNGTFVDGVRVGQAELAVGSTVRVGETELVVAVPATELPAFHGIVSAATCMQEVFELVRRVAPAPVPVTIQGETGTGKELVAAAIHACSERAPAAYIPVNCASISRELVESELFGHEKGAFTGAVVARKGAFEEASGGTIFLDEIGELSLDVQAKLLRALELGEVRRVGSSRPFRVDARVVCATNRDLRAAVKRGLFREDLYYRLAVVHVELPPLRRRPGDVELLARHFVRELAPRGTTPELEAEALERLARHGWPGNVRELRNVLARALLLRRGPTVAASDLQLEGGEAPPAAGEPAAEGDGVLFLAGKTLEAIAEEATRKALRRHGGNRRAAARELGIARSTMQKRAQELGVAAADEDDE